MPTSCVLNIYACFRITDTQFKQFKTPVIIAVRNRLHHALAV